VLGATLAAAPPAARLAEAAGGRAVAWLVLAALYLGPMIASVVVLRAARAGLRAFGGEGADARLTAALLATSGFAVYVVILGAVLRATTHHHALAGATFALIAAAGGATIAGFSARAAAAVFERGPRLRSALLVLAVALGALALAVLAVALGRAPPASGAPAAAALLVDGLAYLLAALFASRGAFAARRGFAALGPPLAGALLVAGFSALRAPALAAAVGSGAPLTAWAVRQFVD